MKKTFTIVALALTLLFAFTACSKDELTNDEIQVAKKWTLYKWENKYVGVVDVTNGINIELKSDRTYTNSIPNFGASTGTWMVISNKLSMSSSGSKTAYVIMSSAPDLILMDNNNDGVNDSTTYYLHL